MCSKLGRGAQIANPVERVWTGGICDALMRVIIAMSRIIVNAECRRRGGGKERKRERE